MAKDKVVIELGGRFANRLVRYYNPLELEQPQQEWIRDPILSGTNVLNPKNIKGCRSNQVFWYNNIPEPGKNPYSGIVEKGSGLSSHREGEYFGNYMRVLSELVRCPIPYDRTGEFNVYNYYSSNKILSKYNFFTIKKKSSFFCEKKFVFIRKGIKLFI